MANNYALAMNDVQEFKTWLMQTGWNIQKIRGEKEIVRAISEDYEKPLIIYKQNTQTIFASVPNMWYGIVDDFYQHKIETANLELDSAEDKMFQLISIIEKLKNELCNNCKYPKACNVCAFREVKNDAMNIVTGIEEME